MARVIIVAVTANTESGGQAVIPVQYFSRLLRRGADVHLVCHVRNRENLEAVVPDGAGRIHYVPDRLICKLIHAAGSRIPLAIKSMTVWPLVDVIANLDMRQISRRLVRECSSPSVVHEPVPVSPRRPSLMVRMGAPVIIGPMNGGMAYPEGLRHDVSGSELLTRRVLRSMTEVLNVLAGGKRHAAALLVANDRTRAAIPAVAEGVRVIELVENGVDLDLFTGTRATDTHEPRFVFLGRLVDWKRVDILLHALSMVPPDYRLDIIGSGPMEESLRARSRDLGIDDRITWHGSLSHESVAEVMAKSSALVLASVYECGGAVVLEAMAASLPVIATAWGGPAEYVVHGVTGLLVEPTSAEGMARGFAEAMIQLADDRTSGIAMGREGRRRAEALYSWEAKIEVIQEIYEDVLASR